MTVRHFLNLADAGGEAIAAILGDAQERKSARAGWPKGRADADRPLDGFVLGMIFEKPSTRTRLSFALAMQQLGGTSMILEAGTTQLGRGETISDTARVLSRFCDAVMIRTDHHEKAVELAEHSDVPVINGLTDLSHPCQVLADMLTLIDHKARLAGSKWAWLGDGNNVCNSLIEAASLMHFELKIGCPDGYEPDRVMLAAAAACDAKVMRFDNPREAVAGAEVVVTDTWTSMGHDDSEHRQTSLARFAVDEAVMAQAAPGALFMHCLPAHRGEEVSEAVIDGPQSVVWDEAENRLHVQQSLLLWCLGKI